MDTVLTCIDTVHGLDEVLLGPEGVLAGVPAPRLVVDCSTMHPDVTRRQAAALAEHGIAMVDAPVSGGPLGAAAGTLAVFVGGAEDDVALARPVLAAFGIDDRSLPEAMSGGRAPVHAHARGAEGRWVAASHHASPLEEPTVGAR